MKTSGWINLIGILCIVFGISGLSESIAHIYLIKRPDEVISELSPKAQSLVTILGYIGVLVYTFYLMAGIFFLLKKTFSLQMVYIALIISIFFIIIPLIVINKSLIESSDFIFNYKFNLSNLLSPSLDMALLFGVGLISKNYYKKPEQLNKSKILTSGLMKILTFLGLVCFIIPLLILGLWIYVFNLEDNQPDRVAIFYSFLPDFLHGRYSTSYLSLAFCTVAIILSSVSLKLSGILWKTLNIIILIFASLLLLLNLFQLM